MFSHYKPMADNDAPGAWPIWTPGSRLAGIIKGLTKHCFTQNIDCEPECRMLPTPREFSRHILSERTTQAASNKRRLHPVSGGISL